LGVAAGSTADISVILQGLDSQKCRPAFYSTVHGAGRVISRAEATGKFNRRTKKREGGLVTQDKMDKVIKDYGVELRGGGLDESPFVYRKLQEVIDAHKGTIEVLNVLRPVGVSMAGR